MNEKTQTGPIIQKNRQSYNETHTKTIQTYHAAKKFKWANENKAMRCTNTKKVGENMFLFGNDLFCFCLEMICFCLEMICFFIVRNLKCYVQK